MGTVISDVPTAAGVDCPKKTGEMSKDTPCRNCMNYIICLRAVAGVLS